MHRLALIPALALLLALTPATGALAAMPDTGRPAATQQGGGISVPLVGSTTDAVATITDVRLVDGVLTVVGTITGEVTTLVNGVPVVTEVTDAPFSAAITQITGTCEILELDIGPIHLDLLGLVVDLSDVHLDIVAVPGSGNLLGNLLCAVAHLLDNGGPLTGIAALLDRIIGAL